MYLALQCQEAFVLTSYFSYSIKKFYEPLNGDNESNQHGVTVTTYRHRG